MNDARLVRLPKGEDLLAALANYCLEHNVTKGQVSLIGALERAVLGYYPQDSRQYVTRSLDGGAQILSGLGNVSLKDGLPCIHLHLTLLLPDFTVTGGHAMPGNILFAGEACITPIEGPRLHRGHDPATGLPLWDQTGM
jgi:predicted DNA-binding protein with PD1-like motif